MEKSREIPVVANEELQAIPRRALPAMKPVASNIGHNPEEVHERLARNYQCASESASRTCLAADRSMEIAANMDYYKVKAGTPLHERFASLVASV